MTGQLLVLDLKPVQLSHERALYQVRFAVHETTQEKFAKRWLLGPPSPQLVYPMITPI